MNQRVASLRAATAEQSLPAVLITQPENRRYLSGFTGSAGMLLIDQEEALLLTDFRYYEQVRSQAPDFGLVEVTDTPLAALVAEVGRLGLSKIGFESSDVTVDAYEQWHRALPSVEWAPIKGLVENLREVKDADELRAIERAVRIADEALEYMMGWITPGVTERQIAWELEVHMRTHGADGLSFTTIVASGPHGAMAHAVTTNRPVQAGDRVVIDMGALVDGYCSDITRSFCVGRADDTYREVWDLVLRAQQEAKGAIAAGVSCAQVDAVARQIIYDAGQEGRFGHGLGHGVGLAIHERPRLGRTSTDILRAGSVVTVEPGVYIPGWGGIRTEDMVVVEESGCRVLTGCRKIVDTAEL